MPGGPPNTRIAAQCCTGLNTGTPGCRRKPTSSGGVGGNEDCVAGNAGEDPDITPFTYAQVYHFCTSLGLTLCGEACATQGCHYDDYPVWTGIECPVQPLPPGLPPWPPGKAPRPPPPAPPPRPPPRQWDAYTDPATGQIWWWCEATQEASYDRPAELAAA